MATRKKTPDILTDLLGDGMKSKRNDSVRLSESDDVSPGPKVTTRKMRAKPPAKGTALKDTPQEAPIPLHAPGETGEIAALDTQNNLNFLAFSLEGQGYALPLAQVEQALRMVALVHIPEAPPWIAGLVNVHGHVIPVIDLRMRLGKPQREVYPDDRLVVVRGSGQKVALMVDHVSEVLEIPAHQMEMPQDALSKSGPLKAVIQREEDLFLVLDVDHLLPGTAETLLLQEYQHAVKDAPLKEKSQTSRV